MRLAHQPSLWMCIFKRGWGQAKTKPKLRPWTRSTFGSGHYRQFHDHTVDPRPFTYKCVLILFIFRINVESYFINLINKILLVGGIGCDIFNSILLKRYLYCFLYYFCFYIFFIFIKSMDFLSWAIIFKSFKYGNDNISLTLVSWSGLNMKQILKSFRLLNQTNRHAFFDTDNTRFY